MPISAQVWLKQFLGVDLGVLGVRATSGHGGGAGGAGGEPPPIDPTRKGLVETGLFAPPQPTPLATAMRVNAESSADRCLNMMNSKRQRR